ncbi:MAG: hypothetical protein HY689_03940 [Chloroflexi bacterium]|nr:hypothetical protein [Chloroflexota bacterium]
MKRERLLALAAAVLFLASLAFPYWTARMQAPTYPEGDLLLHMYAYKYAGDIEEWDRVGRLVGVRVPPPIPDVFFQLFPAAVVATSILALAAAARERLLAAAAVAPWALMLVVGAWGQYSLYLYGHSLDPDRPLRFLEPFTPPIVGIVTLGKISMYHYPDISSLLFTIGGVLLVLSAWQTGRLPFVSRRRLVAVAQR